MTTPRRPCTALRLDGQPCRAWALRPAPDQPATGPALCAAHRRQASQNPPQQPPPQDATPLPLVLPGQPIEDYYGGHFTSLETTALETGQPDSLDGEIRLVRVMLMRLFVDMSARGVSGEEMNRRALALFEGVQLVGNLLQLQTTLHGARGNAALRILEQVAQEYTEELGL